MSRTTKDSPAAREGRKTLTRDISRAYGKPMDFTGTEVERYRDIASIEMVDGLPVYTYEGVVKIACPVYKPRYRRNNRATAKRDALTAERAANLGTHDFGSLPGFPNLMAPVIEFQERKTNRKANRVDTRPRGPIKKAQEATMNITARVPAPSTPAKWNEPEARPMPFGRPTHGTSAKMPARVTDTDAVKVSDLARELGLDAKTIVAFLADHGEWAKATTKVASPVVRLVREAFAA